MVKGYELYVTGVPGGMNAYTICSTAEAPAVKAKLAAWVSSKRPDHPSARVVCNAIS